MSLSPSMKLRLRLLIAVAVIVCLFAFALRPVTTEAGAPAPEAAAFVRLGFLPLRLETDLTDPAFALPGVYDVRFTLLNVNLMTKLTVRDTRPPSAEPQTATVLCGAPVAAEDCVSGLADATDVSCAFAVPPDTSAPGDRPVTVVLTDEAGNTASVASSVHVLALPYTASAEAGSNAAAVARAFAPDGSAALAEPSAVASLGAGEYDAVLTVDGARVPARLVLVDTTPPSADGCDVLTFLGAERNPPPLSHAGNLVDASAVTAEYLRAPDYTALGTQPVTVVLTDAFGNASQIEATLTVSREVPPPSIHGAADLTFYAGTPVSFTSGVSAVDYSGLPLLLNVWAPDLDPDVPGEYELQYYAYDEWDNVVRRTVSVTVLEPDYELILSEAREVLETIVTDGMTERERARAIYDWMTDRENVTYRVSEEKERWLRAAHSGFTTRCGDCYVYYAMARSLLDAAGIENLEITRDNAEYPHFWNLVYITDEGWYHFDTCPHFVNYPLESFLLTNREVRTYSRYYVADYYTFDPSLYPEIN